MSAPASRLLHGFVETFAGRTRRVVEEITGDYADAAQVVVTALIVLILQAVKRLGWLEYTSKDNRTFRHRYYELFYTLAPMTLALGAAALGLLGVFDRWQDLL